MKLPFHEFSFFKATAPLKKKARDGLRVSSGHLCEAEATTEPASETSNPRGFDTRRRNKITKGAVALSN